MRVFSLVALLLWSGLAFAEGAVVIDGVHANLRAGKTEAYRVIRVLPPNTPLQVLQIDKDYAEVRTADGDVGWLPVRLLTLFPGSGPAGVASQPTDPPPSAPAASAQGPNAAASSQAAATERQLQETRERLSRLEDELAAARNRAAAGDVVTILVGCGALLAGMALGMALLRAYYRRRLKGLRI